MIVPEYGRCPVCDSVPVIIVRTEYGNMCAGCVRMKFTKGLSEDKTKDSDELVDDGKRAGGPWQDGITND